MPPDPHTSTVPQPYTGTEPFVFVSYAHRDAAVALAEIARLQALGCRVWYDRGIRFGSDWAAELELKIQACERFVVFLSPNAVASEHVRDEISQAKSFGKTIYAVYIEPTQLPPGMGMQSQRFQFLSRYSLPEAEYEEKLCECLPPEVFAVLTPREPVARDLVPRVGAALAAAGVSGAAVHALYLRHVPDGWPRVRPQGDAARALAAATADLLRAPVRRDGRVPELELLAGAAALAPEPARGALLDAVRAGAVAQGAPDPVPAPAPALGPTAPAPTYLTITVAPERTTGGYSVAARLHAPDVERCLAGGTAAADELPAVVDRVRAAAECHFGTNDSVRVELYLPRELLGLPVETWEVRVWDEGGAPLGEEHPVVLRSADRYLCPPDLRADWLARLGDRAAALRDCPLMALTDVLPASHPAPALAYRAAACGARVVRERLKERRVVCVVLPDAPPATPAREWDMFNTLLKAGVPMLAWPRDPAADGGALHEVPPREIPERLRKLRFEQEAAGRLALLWDDPHRPPPEPEPLSDAVGV